MKATRKSWAAVALVAMVGFAVDASAVPATVALEGLLQAKGGGPASDGKYSFTFSLYTAKTGGTAVWSEAATVTVKSGAFSHVLGSVKPMDLAKLSGLKALWLGTRVGKDPELPRETVHSVFFASVAQTARQLSCTGCVKASALAFDGDFNLKGKALVAGKVTSSSDVVAKGAVVAASFSGSGAKLTGVAKAGQVCKVAGEVVKGINADGTLKCVKAMDPSALPADGLNEISNNQLTNQFDDVVTSTKAVDIADNSPAGISSVIDFPDIGLAQKLTVSFTITGHKGDSTGKTGVSDLLIQLKDPNGGLFVLHNKTGNAQTVTVSYPPTKPVKGDLTSWHGKNPKGKWTLSVFDSKYLDNKIDGKLSSWNIKIQTLSNKKVATTGDHYVNGTLHGAVQLKNMGKAPFACGTNRVGYMYYNTTLQALHVCQGKEWVPIVLATLGSAQNPAKSCRDLILKSPSSTDGNYWIDPDGAAGTLAAVLVACDMKNGGWTKVAETTSYATKVYSESSKYYDFKYVLSDAFINALKKVSTQAKQSWACHTRGVGSQNYYRGWDNNNYKQSGSGTCWHSNNSSTVSGSGTNTTFAQIPIRAWQSTDCGDSSEFCSYNVGDAFFK